MEAVKRMETGQVGTGEAGPPRSLVVVCSYHHNNTEKVARAIAGCSERR